MQLFGYGGITGEPPEPKPSWSAMIDPLYWAKR